MPRLLCPLTLLLLCGAIAAYMTSPLLGQISPEIVNELKDFVDLIPAAKVDEIIAEHYILDGDFRKALNYVRGADFKKLLERLQEIPEIIEILDFLHMRVQHSLAQQQQHHRLNTAYAEPRQGRWRRALRHASFLTPQTPWLVEAPDTELEIVLLDGKVQTVRRAVRSFTSFVEELLRNLPRGNYVRLINEKRNRSAAFAAFYAALRSTQLRPMVDAAMQAPQVTAVISTLRAHAIDAKDLEAIAFEVISWGPV